MGLGRQIGRAMVVRMSLGVRTPRAARLGAGAKRFIHDFANRARATPTLGAASQTAIDLTGGSRDILRAGHGSSDIVVCQDVTGTNDH